jgi:hypothetical protein
VGEQLLHGGALGGTPVPTGVVDINGIVDLFHGAPEFIPFSITPATSVASPEPASIALVLSGILGFALLRSPGSRRKR